MANVSHYDQSGIKKKMFEINEKQFEFIRRFGEETYRSDSDVIRYALNKLEEIYNNAKQTAKDNK